MSLKQSQEIKTLQSRLTIAEAEFSAARDVVRDAQRKETAARQHRDNLKAQLAKLTEKPKEIIVTEHAILRYIERVYGIDLEEIRTRMLGGSVVQLIDQFGSGKIPCEGGRLIVKDRTVITVEAA